MVWVSVVMAWCSECGMNGCSVDRGREGMVCSLAHQFPLSITKSIYFWYHITMCYDTMIDLRLFMV